MTAGRQLKWKLALRLRAYHEFLLLTSILGLFLGQLVIDDASTILSQRFDGSSLGERYSQVFSAGVNLSRLTSDTIQFNILTGNTNPSGEVLLGLGVHDADPKTSLLGDQELYAYEGWLLVTGSAQATVWRNGPPLAKYLIGISEVLLHNQFVLTVFFGFATLLIVYFAAKILLAKSLLALVPVFLLAEDKLFRAFTLSSYLDIYLTFFVALTVLFFLLGRRRPLFLVFAAAALGWAVASKWTGVFVLPALLGALVLWRDWRGLRWMLLTLPVAMGAYVLAYAGYFWAGHTFSDFITLHRQMLEGVMAFRYGRGAPPPFSLLFTVLSGISGPGTYIIAHLSSGRVDILQGITLQGLFNPLTWPLTITASLASFLYSHQRREPEIHVAALGYLAPFVLMATGQTFIWYLLPFLPFGLIAIGYVLAKLHQSATHRRRATLVLIGYLAAVFVTAQIVLPSFVQTG